MRLKRVRANDTYAPRLMLPYEQFSLLPQTLSQTKMIINNILFHSVSISYILSGFRFRLRFIPDWHMCWQSATFRDLWHIQNEKEKGKKKPKNSINFITCEVFEIHFADCSNRPQCHLTVLVNSLNELHHCVNINSTFHLHLQSI